MIVSLYYHFSVLKFLKENFGNALKKTFNMNLKKISWYHFAQFVSYFPHSFLLLHEAGVIDPSWVRICSPIITLLTASAGLITAILYICLNKPKNNEDISREDSIISIETSESIVSSNSIGRSFSEYSLPNN